jgi:hypothetical protein
MMYTHIDFPDFRDCGYAPSAVEDPKGSYRLMDGRARLALKGEWKTERSSFVSDPRDLLRTNSEAPWLLRFACAASRVRGL